MFREVESNSLISGLAMTVTVSLFSFVICGGLSCCKIVKLDLYDKILRLNLPKNLVGLDGQGKSQSQDFIDELRSLGHMQGLFVPFACIGSSDPVRVLSLYTTNTLDTL